MNSHLPNDIDHILDSIYRHGAALPPHQQDENRPRRTINVFIDVQEQEDSQALPPMVEGTLDTDTNTTNTTVPLPDDGEQTTPPSPTSTTEPHKAVSSVPPTHYASMRPRLIVLMVALVAVLAVLIGLNLSFAFAPSATVTLVTTSQHLTTTDTLELVTSGVADVTKHQLPGRMLPALTMSQQKSVVTTGGGHQDATAAHGILTFYNSATYSQTVPAGTLVMGSDGTQIVTDADAVIPAASFPTFGQRSVLAHAVLTGPQGNIRAGDVYGACCRVNVSAVSSAFTGGQNARTYQTVAPQDIQDVVSSVKASLEQSVQVALHTQVQPTETLVTPLACTQHVTPNHMVGEEAQTVIVTIDNTCTGTVYDTQAFTTITTQQATQDMMKKLGTGYTPTELQSSITQAVPKAHGMVDLHVTSRSVWAYQYDPEQVVRLKAMLAGMNKDKAQATILHLVGVQSVSISITNNGMTIPTDTARIDLLFVQMS
jgi:hypothetical protein